MKISPWKARIMTRTKSDYLQVTTIVCEANRYKICRMCGKPRGLWTESIKLWQNINLKTRQIIKTCTLNYRWKTKCIFFSYRMQQKMKPYKIHNARIRFHWAGEQACVAVKTMQSIHLDFCLSICNTIKHDCKLKY